jgi:hypothetical protein
VSESLPELIPFNQQVHQVLSDTRPFLRVPKGRGIRRILLSTGSVKRFGELIA